jgi:hypothetical protein
MVFLRHIVVFSPTVAHQHLGRKPPVGIEAATTNVASNEMERRFFLPVENHEPSSMEILVELI